VYLATMPKHQPKVYFLVVKEDAGFCDRKGVCALALKRWHELEMRAGIEFREMRLK
jgi:hypothetical protein